VGRKVGRGRGHGYIHTFIWEGGKAQGSAGGINLNKIINENESII
jgi:hypothetical protein